MLTQFGARIGEAYAINDNTTDFNRGTIDLTETVVYKNGKMLSYLMIRKKIKR